MITPLPRFLALLLLILISAGGGARAATLSISCGALGVELRLCRQGVEAWSQRTGNQVKVVSTPNSATERFALYQQILASHSSDIDILQIDVVWPGTLAPHLVDLSQYIGSDVTRQFFPTLIANDTIAGKLVAMPWFTDAGVLYYRKDLLEKYHVQPPATWQQLTTIARRIQNAERKAGNPRMYGFVFQAKGYEGLTCDALEWIDSFGGGALIDCRGQGDGRQPARRGSAANGHELDRRHRAAGRAELRRGGKPRRVSVRQRRVHAQLAVRLDAGQCRGQSDPRQDRRHRAARWRGGRGRGHHTGVLGGWQLAVSRYSKHPQLAADLVRYLTSYAEQKHRAIAGSYNPTIAALYRDPDVLAAAPFFGTLYTTFEHAVARPSRIAGSKYARVSAEFYYTVHDVLSGKTAAAPALTTLQRKLTRLSHGGKWQ